jgi:hypothetical protein
MVIGQHPTACITHCWQGFARVITFGYTGLPRYRITLATQRVIHADVRAYLRNINVITKMKKLFRVSEIIITCLTLLLLIYYSLFNYAAELNSESRIGDDEFFIKEVSNYAQLYGRCRQRLYMIIYCPG